MNAEELDVQLRAMGACREAVEWSKGKTFSEAWQQCERPDWMVWLCGRMCGAAGWATRQQIVLLVCEFAESSLSIFEKRYPNDQRPRKAIEAARAWANGDATVEQVRTACAPGFYASYGGYDNAAVAQAAAYVAVYVSAAYVAVYASAAVAAAVAAAAYAEAVDSCVAFRKKKEEVLREFADKVRERLRVPDPWSNKKS